jgi:hypothetical protein
MKLQQQKKNNKKDPSKGTLNIFIIIRVMKQVSPKAITNGGTVFPIRISNVLSGLTMSCSKVPTSLSLAIDNAVKRSVIINASSEINTESKYHLYSKLGLNQFLIEGTMFTLFNFKISLLYSLLSGSHMHYQLKQNLFVVHLQEFE